MTRSATEILFRVIAGGTLLFLVLSAWAGMELTLSAIGKPETPDAAIVARIIIPLLCVPVVLYIAQGFSKR